MLVRRALSINKSSNILYNNRFRILISPYCEVPIKIKEKIKEDIIEDIKENNKDIIKDNKEEIIEDNKEDNKKDTKCIILICGVSLFILSMTPFNPIMLLILILIILNN